MQSSLATTASYDGGDPSLTIVDQATIAMPIVGDQVLYVLADGRSKGEARPAFVVKIWNTTSPLNYIDIQVLTNGVRDYPPEHKASDGTLGVTAVQYSETKEPGTWHWKA